MSHLDPAWAVVDGLFLELVAPSPGIFPLEDPSSLAKGRTFRQRSNTDI